MIVKFIYFCLMVYAVSSVERRDISHAQDRNGIIGQKCPTFSFPSWEREKAWRNALSVLQSMNKNIDCSVKIRKNDDSMNRSENFDRNYHVAWSAARFLENGKSNASKPAKVYAEMMIVVDYQLHINIGNNVNRTIDYVQRFWNSVELKLRPVKNPEISISIAGIIIADNDQALTYLRDNKVRNSDKHNVLTALTGSHNFWSNKKDVPRNTYDGLVTMTTKKLCLIEKDTCKSETEGKAGKNICNNNENHIIIRDSGYYHGISNAEHKLANLLGVTEHDDAFVTKATNGSHIMASVVMANATYWSDFVINQFRKFYLSGKASCVYNSPKPDSYSKRILPGYNIPHGMQCTNRVKDGGLPKNFISCRKASGCGNLQCARENKPDSCESIAVPILDGTSCNNGKGICITGICKQSTDLHF